MQKAKQTKDRTIVVKLKTLYGRDRIYPANDAAKQVLKMTRKPQEKTLTLHGLQHMQRLGHKVEIHKQSPRSAAERLLHELKTGQQVAAH